VTEATAVKIRGRLAGAADLKAVLDVVGPKVLRQGARRGVTVAAQEVSKAAKARVPTRTKSLKKAIGHKVKANRQKTGYIAVIGPRKDAKGTTVGGVGKKKAKFRRKVRIKGSEIIINPVKYAHLVEGGRKAVKVTRRKVLSDGRAVYGTKVRAVPPRPFMRPAWEENQARCAAIIRQKIAEAAKRVRK
jgi:HK97 gp10 family phage protein